MKYQILILGEEGVNKVRLSASIDEITAKVCINTCMLHGLSKMTPDEIEKVKIDVESQLRSQEASNNK